MEYDYGCRSIAAGDLNNDGVVDLVVGNSRKPLIICFLGIGDGNFHSGLIHEVEGKDYIVAVKTFDFNDDGRLDVVFISFNSNSLEILFGRGDGSFDGKFSKNLGVDRPSCLHATDLNSDGSTDLIVGSWGGERIRIFFTSKSGAFLKDTSVYLGLDALAMAIESADLNGDSYKDLIVLDYGRNSLVFFYSNGEEFVRRRILSTGRNSAPTLLLVDYFNADRFFDVLVGNSNDRNLILFIGKNESDFHAPIEFSLNQEVPISFGLSDFNRNRRRDLIVAFEEKLEVEIFLDFQNDSFAERTSVFVGNLLPTSLIIEDFDRDQLVDVAIADEGANSINLLFSSEIDFQNEQILLAEQKFDSFITARLNDDDLLDLIGIDRVKKLVHFHLAGPNRTFRYENSLETGRNPMKIATFDRNNDQIIDFAITNFEDHTVDVFIRHEQFPIGKVTLFFFNSNFRVSFMKLTTH